MNSLNPVAFVDQDFTELKTLLENYHDKKQVILVDTNTKKYCLTLLLEHVPELNHAEIFQVAAEENSKSMEICFDLWKRLTDNNFNRNDLLINLGGGMISDLGGFVAATYKRGMDYINIPTSLLAQVDASIGGKTGVNFHHFKNLIGSIYLPKSVFIFNDFLTTLPKRQILSGFGEVIKSGLIADKELWKEIKQLDEISIGQLTDIVKDACQIKLDIVKSDLHEKSIRKTLNFGHTIGHAIETYSMSNHPSPCFHGEAIAMGMICESYISWKTNKITQEDHQEIEGFIVKHYAKIDFDLNDFSSLLETMKKDKKNISNEYNFSLLDEIGLACFDVKVEEELIKESLVHLHNINF